MSPSHSLLSDRLCNCQPTLISVFSTSSNTLLESDTAAFVGATPLFESGFMVVKDCPLPFAIQYWGVRTLWVWYPANSIWIVSVRDWTRLVTGDASTQICFIEQPLKKNWRNKHCALTEALDRLIRGTL